MPDSLNDSYISMKLKKVSISTFRSIVDVRDTDLEERLTVLVGRNEQGKTTFLKALASFDPSYSYVPSDLPNHLATKLEERPKSEIPVITLWLSPDGADKNRLKDIVPDAAFVDLFRVTRYFDGHYSYSAVSAAGVETKLEFALPNISKEVGALMLEGESLSAKLGVHAARQPSFKIHKAQADAQLDAFKRADFNDAAQLDNLVNTVSVALMAVPGQDQPIQNDIALFGQDIRATINSIKTILSRDPVGVFFELLPRFAYHTTSLDKIPNEVNLADFIKDPEKTSRGMANLCKATGLSIQRIAELASTADADRRHVAEDHYKNYISGGINEYWTQESYEVHFQFERDKLTVSITDENYTWRIPPSERSDGFQWYLSFYSTLLSAVSAPRPTIVLLDNPGFELHADGQRDIKRFLAEKLPWNTQIIYITHSPAMIDPYDLEQVREIELMGSGQGTKVRKLRINSGFTFDLAEPVRSAVAASLVTSLMFNELSILVDGAANKPLLEGAFAATQPGLVEKIVINGSVSESKERLPLFYERAKLPYVVYLDADGSGRGLVQGLERAGVPKSKITLLSDALPGDGGFELEGLLSEEFYHRAVSETYSDQQVPQPPPSAERRTRKYERLFRDGLGFEFSRRRVGETVRRLLQADKGDQLSVDKLKQITEKLLGALRTQVADHARAANK